MGAGDFPAGMGPAGFDPVWVPPPLGAPFLPRAEYFDPSQKRFFLTQEELDGEEPGTNPTYIDMHPVFQIVVLRCSTQKGQSKSAVQLGTQLGIICARQPPARVPQLAYTEVKRVLQDLLDNGDILLISVVADTSVRGRDLFAITVVNLRDPATNPRFPLQNAQTAFATATPTNPTI